jgi:hypothetical protein
MRYIDGVEVRLGDRVRIYDSDSGTVVFSIDAGEYSEGFPEKDWGYLKKGVMIRTDHGALVHLDSSAENQIHRI